MTHPDPDPEPDPDEDTTTKPEPGVSEYESGETSAGDEDGAQGTHPDVKPDATGA
ncbi:MAG: hypothetical protein JWL73_3691 [Actinomycetia bacterium]|nr:hypothetical protein [Actinomycetes bacterium]